MSSEPLILICSVAISGEIVDEDGKLIFLSKDKSQSIILPSSEFKVASIEIEQYEPILKFLPFSHGRYVINYSSNTVTDYLSTSGDEGTLDKYKTLVLTLTDTSDNTSVTFFSNINNTEGLMPGKYTISYDFNIEYYS